MNSVTGSADVWTVKYTEIISVISDVYRQIIKPRHGAISEDCEEKLRPTIRAGMKTEEVRQRFNRDGSIKE